jgi:hypothetical protein
MRLVPDIETARKMNRPFPTLGELHVLEHIARVLGNEPDVEIYFQPKVASLRPDIVVLREGFGCSIIEVKDWVIGSYVVKLDNKMDSGTEWRSKSTGAEIMSPHLQVIKYKKRLFSEAGLDLSKVFNKSLYGTIRTVIILTNSSNEAAQAASHRYVPVLGRDGLPEDSSDLMRVLGLEKMSSSFTKECYHAIKSVLDPSKEPEPPVISVKLSERQISALKFPASRRRKIRGVAGSGKTIVGATLAARSAAEGLHVLYLVFNNAARHNSRNVLRSLDLEFPRAYVTIETVFKLASPFNKVTEDRFLVSNQFYEAARDKITEALKERVELPDSERYDVVIIDEAQDHEYEWMQVIEQYYLAPEGTMLVLADEAQNIYGTSLEEQRVKTPIPGTWFRLNEHKRSDPSISKLCDQFRRSFLGDSESNELQTEMGLGLVELHIVEDHSPGNLANCILANEKLVDILTGNNKDSTSLIIGRTSSIIGQVTDECRKYCGDRGTLSTMMETDQQRATLFLETLKSIFEKPVPVIRCASVTLTYGEADHIKEAVSCDWHEWKSNKRAEIVELLLASNEGAKNRLNWVETLRSLYDRTLSLSERRFADLQHNDTPLPSSYKDDIVHEYSFGISKLRSELKEAAFIKNSRVVISTAHSSKGIERDQVFLLIDAHWHMSPQANELMYTAMSRARSELFLICSGKSPYRTFFDNYLDPA